MPTIVRSKLAKELIEEAEENGGTLGVAVLAEYCKLRLQEMGHYGFIDRPEFIDPEDKLQVK